MQQQKWWIGGVSYNQLTIGDRNEISYQLRSLIAQMNNIQAKDVWITLEQGPLIVQAEIEPSHSAATWPDTQQLMVVIEEARQGSTMADRAQRSQAQPFTQAWLNGSAPQEHADDSRMTHNP